ncbi:MULTISPECIES: PaREP1 family protein [Archaea]|nr:PaREP1 family protein [Thermofilum adornatum]
MGVIGLPGAERHLALALRYLEEGRTLIEKDPVQASEKLYKAAEEAVKALAIGLDQEQARIAAKEGAWWTRLLNRASEGAAEKLGIEELALWWKAAYYLHVEGFHEARLDSEDVKRNYRYIEALVTTTEKILKAKA